MKDNNGVSKLQAWVLFTMICLLYLSDYASRQCITPMLQMIKTDWLLTDSQLGLLISAVTISVGISTIPIALLADRWGRVKSITLMAFVWCFAVIGCGLAQNFEQMMLARFIMGFGEGAYAAGAAALLCNAFSVEKRAAILGISQSFGMFGSVLGIATGGVLAANYGWHMTFIAIGVPGLLIAVLFPFLVKDYKTVKLQDNTEKAEKASTGKLFMQIVREIFGSRTGNWIYAGFALQMSLPIVLVAWTSVFLNRYYGMDVKQAASMTAIVVLIAAIGMALGGNIADWLSRKNPKARIIWPACSAALTGICLLAAFSMPPGPLGLGLIFLGAFFSNGHTGASSAAVLDVTHPAVRATVAGVLVTVGNLVGQTCGPLLVGVMSDTIGLKTALTIIPVAGFLASLCYIFGKSTYLTDMAKWKDMSVDKHCSQSAAS